MGEIIQRANSSRTKGPSSILAISYQYRVFKVCLYATNTHVRYEGAIEKRVEGFFSMCGILNSVVHRPWGVQDISRKGGVSRVNPAWDVWNNGS